MTPEDVLIEAIAAASRYGDTPALRDLECRKLNAAISYLGVASVTDGAREEPDVAD